MHTSFLELHNAQSGQSLFKAELPNFSLDCVAVNRNAALWAASGTVWRPSAEVTAGYAGLSADYEVRVWNRESPDKPRTLPADMALQRWYSVPMELAC